MKSQHKCYWGSQGLVNSLIHTNESLLLRQSVTQLCAFPPYIHACSKVCWLKWVCAACYSKSQSQLKPELIILDIFPWINASCVTQSKPDSRTVIRTKRTFWQLLKHWAALIGFCCCLNVSQVSHESGWGCHTNTISFFNFIFANCVIFTDRKLPNKCQCLLVLTVWWIPNCCHGPGQLQCSPPGASWYPPLLITCTTYLFLIRN